MGKNLAKLPLFAVIYAALLSFSAAFIPYSQTYLEAGSEFYMPVSGYLLLIAYSLWVSLMMILVFSMVKMGVPQTILMGASFLGLQWLMPRFPQLFGIISLPMTGGDIGLEILAGAVCNILLIVLCILLLPQNTVKPPSRFKIKIIHVIIWFFVLPVIFMVLYFLVWYFVEYRSEAVRLLFYEGAEDTGFIAVIIDMLLTNARRVPLALLQGLFYMILAYPLLMLFSGKRLKNILFTALFFLTGALRNIVPSAVLPSDVRFTLLLSNCILLLLFGVLTGLLLYTALPAIEEAPAPPPQPQQAQRVPVRRPAAPTRR